MNTAWSYATRITDAFAKYGWFARTRGVEGGGRVRRASLAPVHTFPTDDGDVAMKCPTEIAITDHQGIRLSNLGFLPLLHAIRSMWNHWIASSLPTKNDRGLFRKQAAICRPFCAAVRRGREIFTKQYECTI